MAVAVTIRNVPSEVRDELGSRAARSGKSLQEYLRALLIATASRPTVAEVIERAESRVAAAGSRYGAEAILADRDADRR